MIVAQFTNGESIFASNQPADSPPARGLESTSSFADARRFKDAAEMSRWIEARGGTVAEWRAVAIP